MDSSYKNTGLIRPPHLSKLQKNSQKSPQNLQGPSISSSKARWPKSHKSVSILHTFGKREQKPYSLPMASTQTKFSIDFSRRQRRENRNESNKKIAEEMRISLFGSSRGGNSLRFSKKFDEDENKKINKEKKIREENVSSEGGLSISSNLSYATGWKKNNSRKQNHSYVFHQRVSEKKNSKEINMVKTSAMFRKGDLQTRDLFANLSSQNFGKKQMFPTKMGFVSTSRLGNRRKLKLKGMRKLEEFGGKKNFLMKDPKSYSTSFVTKRHISAKNREGSSQKRKYREKESSSESSMEKLSGTISAKARSRPDIWGYPNKEKYFLKKSEFFESSEWSKPDVKREKDIITKFMKERGGKPRKKEIFQESEILKRISKKCKKIILEQSRSNLHSRIKVRKRSNNPSIQSLMSLPGNIGKKSVQCPSITSIDPLYLHAFVKKKVKPKLKKGLSFFMAKFKSSRQTKKFFVFENEEKVVRFKKGQRNKIIEHTNDDDYDTDDEQMKLAIRQCEKDFMEALAVEQKKQRNRTRAYSMMNLKKRKTTGLVSEQLSKFQKMQNQAKRNKFVKEHGISTRRQTRKNPIGNSIMSLGSTVASSSFRKTKKPKGNDDRGRKMVKNEFYNGARGKRRAVSILPKRSGQGGNLYQYFPKGCRKRNKMGF